MKPRLRYTPGRKLFTCWTFEATTNPELFAVTCGYSTKGCDAALERWEDSMETGEFMRIRANLMHLYIGDSWEIGEVNHGDL